MKKKMAERILLNIWYYSITRRFVIRPYTLASFDEQKTDRPFSCVGILTLPFTENISEAIFRDILSIKTHRTGLISSTARPMIRDNTYTGHRVKDEPSVRRFSVISIY